MTQFFIANVIKFRQILEHRCAQRVCDRAGPASIKEIHGQPLFVSIHVAAARNIVSNTDLIIVHALGLYMAISVREMDVFRCVMQSGSVTSAAIALNISQPAVSRMLQQAEERLGFRLFVRQKKRLKPTTEAQTLFAEVVNVFAAIEHTQRLALELRDGRAGLLTVATVTGFGHTIVPQAVQRFRADRPDVSVVVQTMTGPEVVTRVAQGRADLGLTVGPIGDTSLESTILCTTRLGCVLPIGHPLVAKDALSAPDLADEQVICPGPHLSIGAAIVVAFAEANLRLRIAVEASQSNIACELVRAGAGIAILDGLGLLSARTNDLVTRPFAPSLQSVARLLKGTKRPVSRLVEEFSGVVQRVTADSGLT
ncbi:LysR family transcriptional regulator [Bradyrhizobium diazoefficiens]|uniref:LysR substrate-binding domain-containing protein n=1 Tax=Bradyrhizobium diazoefficiens TaxID=1355477 RepID=UPI00190E2E46|nr:LysR substrate-binding domain-containing protein [Bradyrhizobium diazoefficiens]MBK3666498.1 LysR family transcriptional regulator [Bradyrhizobium diazoefficiens]